MLTEKHIAQILREIEACQSLFVALQLILDNEHAITDHRPLSVLAGMGSSKLDALLDIVTDHSGPEALQS